MERDSAFCPTCGSGLHMFSRPCCTSIKLLFRATRLRQETPHQLYSEHKVLFECNGPTKKPANFNILFQFCHRSAASGRCSAKPTTPLQLPMEREARGICHRRLFAPTNPKALGTTMAGQAGGATATPPFRHNDPADGRTRTDDVPRCPLAPIPCSLARPGCITSGPSTTTP